MFGRTPNSSGGWAALRNASAYGEDEILSFGAVNTAIGEKSFSISSGASFALCNYGIDLSRRSQIYSGSSMQPKALQVLACIRI